MSIEIENIKYLNDQELHSRMHMIKKLIRDGKLSKKKSEELEIEYCYLDREFKFRENENKINH